MTNYKRKYMELNENSGHIDIKKVKCLYSRTELSIQIQWLIDLAGSKNIINGFIDNFTIKHKKPKNIEIIDITNMANIDKINGKCKIYFYSINGDCGHWVYCDSEGNIQNSYELKHQKRGSNQFCQSFALFYMLKDNYLKTIPELKDMINSINLKEDQFGYNIQQIIKMWKYFIFSNQYPNIKEWLIKSIKELNDEYIKSDPKFKININSTLIDSTLIESKLEFISINAELIALNT